MGRGEEEAAFAAVQRALREREEAVLAYLKSSEVTQGLGHERLDRAVRGYLERPAKRLRPAVLMASAGAVGGDESAAIPAAAAIEVFHTWTLVHDDLIDNDAMRRGGPTVHEELRGIGVEAGYSLREAEEYGRSMAILAGDVQHGWAVSLLAECARMDGVSAEVVLRLIHTLESLVVNDLVRGQALDVEYARRPVEGVGLEEILLMLGLKTGALYEFATRAGAMIGLNSMDASRAEVMAMSQFGRLCGTAFQLRDDILGMIGDERTLGKPVGSDIREGKRTAIVCFALRNASEREKSRLAAILGKREASESEMGEARELLMRLGGVDETARLAAQMLEEGLRWLYVLPESEQRDLLASVARYMVVRSV